LLFYIFLSHGNEKKYKNTKKMKKGGNAVSCPQVPVTTTGQRLSSKTEIYLSVFLLPSLATKVPTP
jgi:hypothetical protein